MGDFGIEGTPMIEGVWTHKQTGKKITIRNSIIDGDTMILITSTGDNITMDDFSENYIQVSEELYDENKNVITDKSVIDKINNQEKQQKKQQAKVKLDVAEDPEQLFQQLIKKENDNIDYNATTTAASTISVKTNNKSSSAYKLLNKLFSKIDIKPQITIVDLENFPANELRMLKTFYDVTDEEIIDYLIDYIFVNDEFKQSIADYLTHQLNEK